MSKHDSTVEQQIAEAVMCSWMRLMSHRAKGPDVKGTPSQPEDARSNALERF